MLDIDDWDQIFEELHSEKELSQETKDFIKFVEANEPALLAFKKGTLKPNYCELPLNKLNYTVPLYVSQETRNFVRLLIVRATLETRKGNYDEAANWYLTCFRTARLVRENGSITHHQTGGANYKLAADNVILSIQNQQFPREVLERLLQDLVEINDTIPPMLESLKVEYLMALYSSELEYTQFAYNMGISIHHPSVPPGLVNSYLYVEGEPEIYLRLMRQWLCNVLPELKRPYYLRSIYSSGSSSLLLYNPTASSVKKRFKMAPAEIDKVWIKSPFFLDQGRGLSYYALIGDRMEIRRIMLVSSLRLEIYRRRHGSYPAKLEDAFPDGKVPIDIFDPAGAPLRYKKEADGSCKVWSVSFNGIDDGGTSMGFGNDDTDFGYHLGKQEETE